MRPHLRLLVLIICLEVVVFGGLLTWALLRSPPYKPTTTSTKPTSEGTFKAPKITPASIAKGFETVTGIVATNSSADKRLFIVEQIGRVTSIDRESQSAAQPFLDITSKVQYDGGEMGLLGLVFHPEFEHNGFFYIFYNNAERQSVLARYQIDTTTGKAKANSEKVLLKLQQKYSNHKGGQLQFGPDGYLYVGFGDGGSGGDPEDQAQNQTLWFGKILRLDVDQGDPYGIPPDNPFVNTPGSKPEIWALGLRNPWRFSFDRSTHDLYIADVGQNKYEEINVQSSRSKGGENYGWRCYEGSYAYNTDGCKAASTYVTPKIIYDHGNNRCSITGGYVYRGALEPSLAGAYFYADYCSGEIFYAKSIDGSWKPTLTANVKAVTTFGEGSNGELYFASQETGEIYQITDSANN